MLTNWRIHRRKTILDRIVSMLAKLGQRGYTIYEETEEYVVSRKDTDSDSDSDPDGNIPPASRQPGGDLIIRRELTMNIREDLRRFINETNQVMQTRRYKWLPAIGLILLFASNFHVFEPEYWQLRPETHCRYQPAVGCF